MTAKDAAEMLNFGNGEDSRPSGRARLFADIVNLCPRGVGCGAAGSGLDDDDADL